MSKATKQWEDKIRRVASVAAERRIEKAYDKALGAGDLDRALALLEELVYLSGLCAFDLVDERDAATVRRAEERLRRARDIVSRSLEDLRRRKSAENGDGG